MRTFILVNVAAVVVESDPALVAKCGGPDTFTALETLAGIVRPRAPPPSLPY